MPDTIALMQLEHRRMQRLLGFVDQQAKCLSLGAPVDHRLLEVAFEYLRGYPDQCHHPKEDAVYEKLVLRAPESADAVRQLVEEHEKLAAMTQSLLGATGALRRNPSAATDDLAQRLRAFLDFYRHHMRLEEEQFFPLALARLSRGDLEEIDFTVFDRPDPLFDRKAEAKYAELSDEIARLGQVDGEEAGHRDESDLLGKIVDLASFNAVMRDFDDSLLLRRATGDGYELLSSAVRLVHIPECSESRAAWCAYFFWKATARAKRGS
jgi:hemerythrin-like domain-containing protein